MRALQWMADWLRCSAYRVQFLQRMGRLLDNLPERDNGTDGGQSTTPCTQSVSASQIQLDSADSNAVRTTDVLVETTASVQSRSIAGELQTLVSNSGATSHLIKVPTGYHQLSCVNTHNGLHSTGNNICMASREQIWSPSATVRQSPHSRLDISVNRDIPLAQRPVTMPTSCSRGGLSPVTVRSMTGTSEPLCVTTPSSIGQGGLLAYGTSTCHVLSASTDGLNGLSPNSAVQSQACSRPVINRGRHQAALTGSATHHSDWVTTRNVES